MNYFAHGRRFTDDPYFLAGTAVPDWLNVADRRVRVRRKHAERFVEDADERTTAVALGIVQHHRDDARFHETAAFNDLSLAFTVRCRDALPHDEGFRPSFLGHILVELLLDAALIQDAPQELDEYYHALLQVDPLAVQEAVNRMTPRPGGTDRLSDVIQGFRRLMFLHDYLDDEKLLYRLNQVMRRVGLAPLPPELAAVFPAARREVARRKYDLLPDG